MTGRACRFLRAGQRQTDDGAHGVPRPTIPIVLEIIFCNHPYSAILAYRFVRELNVDTHNAAAIRPREVVAGRVTRVQL